MSPKLATREASPVGMTRKERARQTKRRVLEAATEIFATRAYEDVQVREIVERADVAHGVMFHHFESKRGLYLAAVRIKHRHEILDSIQLSYRISGPDYRHARSPDQRVRTRERQKIIVRSRYRFQPPLPEPLRLLASQ